MLKRPLAVIGFSMLAVSLIVTNISFKSSVALLIGATVFFCIFLGFKKLRKYKTVIFMSFAIALYVVSFIVAQIDYYNATVEFKDKTEIQGIVCSVSQKTDSTFTYTVKLDNKNYKIRYVASTNKMFRKGDVVKGTVTNGEGDYEEDFLENSLSSKVYFTFFEGEDSFLEKTGERNRFYVMLGKTADWFSNAVDRYIPGESGAIVKAMTIGDKSEISDHTMDCFNYSGTAHLLVISGLHLTLWALSFMRVAEKSSKLRKHTALIGILCVFLYSALTGFSVSVIRAGTMIYAVILGKAVHRDADSINSIGLGLTFILTTNPYSVTASGLWFTTFSTLGILVFAQRVTLAFDRWFKRKRFKGDTFVLRLANTTAISIATTIFTLPIFIMKFKILPVASVLSNIVMIDLALVMIVLAVMGALFHLLGLSLFADVFFTLTGVISNFLKIFTEKIGMADGTTVSVSHRYFKWFLLIALVSVGLAYAVKKYRKVLIKSVSVFLSVAFVLLSLYCTSYDYNTPSVDVLYTESVPAVVVNSKEVSVLINPPDIKYRNKIKEILNSHNEKSVDNVLITENAEDTAVRIIGLYDSFKVEKTLFCYKSPQIFKDRSEDYVKSVDLGGNVTINAENYQQYVEILCKDKSLIIIDSENAENLFKTLKNYDIILLYGENASEIKDSLEDENTYAKIFVPDDTQMISVYFD